MLAGHRRHRQHRHHRRQADRHAEDHLVRRQGRLPRSAPRRPPTRCPPTSATTTRRPPAARCRRTSRPRASPPTRWSARHGRRSTRRSAPCTSRATRSSRDCSTRCISTTSSSLEETEDELLKHVDETITLTSWAEDYFESASGRVVTIHVLHTAADGTVLARETERFAIRGRVYSRAAGRRPRIRWRPRSQAGGRLRRSHGAGHASPSAAPRHRHRAR
mgnify:CR=1 FL=1